MLWACSKSVEGETKKFNSKVNQAKTISVKYPNLKSFVTTEISGVEAEWEKAIAIQDEDEKIDQMSVVNLFTGKGILGALRSFDKTYKSINDKISSLTSKSKTPSEQIASDFAVKEANTALKSVNIKRLVTLDSKSVAIDSINQMKLVLLEGSEALNKISKAIKDRLDAEALARKELKAKNNSKKVSTTSGKTKVSNSPKTSPVTQTAAMWKCKKCGSKHAASASKCKSCGAPKK
jgi:rubrerythrin